MNIRILSIIAILIVGMMIIPATAGKPSGNPIIDAILIRISNIENTLVDLQNQINNIQLIPGEKGDQGIPGTPGANGLACWDLNGNGIGDIAEDINSDGNYDTIDCKGTQGLKGDQGESGISGYEIVRTTRTLEPNFNMLLPDNVIAECPPEKRVLGGGFRFDNYQNRELGSHPAELMDGWVFVGWNEAPNPQNVVVYAICANVQ